MGDDGVRSTDALYDGIAVSILENNVEMGFQSVPMQVDLRLGSVAKSGLVAYFQNIVTVGVGPGVCGVVGDMLQWLEQGSSLLCHIAVEFLLLLPCLYLEPEEKDDSTIETA
jgi:hypothetical protein